MFTLYVNGSVGCQHARFADIIHAIREATGKVPHSTVRTGLKAGRAIRIEGDSFQCVQQSHEQMLSEAA